MLTQITSREWNPGLRNDAALLGDVYDSMPKDPASAVPWYVRMLENPASPLALPGAIDLFGHDCLHALLGRGLMSQDEAFVIGFTMGANPACTRAQARLFAWCAQHLYRPPFRFDAIDCGVYHLAFAAARAMGCRPLDAVDYRAWLDRPLGELRAALGIRPEQLARWYRREAFLWPDTEVSRRLPGVRGAGQRETLNGFSAERATPLADDVPTALVA